MPKVEKRHLTDQVFHARGNVLKAGRGENSYECGCIPEIRVQGKGVLVHHPEIILEKINRCNRTGTRSSISSEGVKKFLDLKHHLRPDQAFLRGFMRPRRKRGGEIPGGIADNDY